MCGEEAEKELGCFSPEEAGDDSQPFSHSHGVLACTKKGCEWKGEKDSCLFARGRRLIALLLSAIHQATLLAVCRRLAALAQGAHCAHERESLPEVAHNTAKEHSTETERTNHIHTATEAGVVLGKRHSVTERGRRRAKRRDRECVGL